MKPTVSDVRVLQGYQMITLLICTFLILAGFPAAPAHARFPIATSAAAINFAFDGTNYLVGVENHQTSPITIGAQRIDASGTKVGGLISTGHYGIAANAAFDGTNYLLIWENDPDGSTNGPFQIYGQFISKGGTTVGSPFAITTPGVWFDGIKSIAFGGGNYLVTYTRLINPDLGDDSTNRCIAGRIVTTGGSMGPEFRISSGYGSASDVAFDGANFFVVWTEDQYDTEIRGRFVSPAGVPGTEISINASAAPSDNPKSVTFDGTNYMVVWNDEVVGTGSWDVFGQKVSPAGAKVGGVITVTSETGSQMAFSVAFDGINYLATWVDMSNLSNWNLYGQYISTSGTPVGSKVTIDAGATNQLGGVGFINGKYLALINNGVVMGSGGLSQVEGTYGLFITPTAVPAAPTISSLSLSSGSTGSAVTLTGTNFLSGGTTVIFNGTLSTSVTVTDPTHLTAYVPSGATTGPIKVVTAGGTATSSSFTVQAAQRTGFPIATGGAAMNFAFDGTNYLVGVQNPYSISIGAQLIDASGNKVGGLISPSYNTGIATNAAFDGTNYLLIWEYAPGGTGPGGFQIYGQFISKAGATVGSPFAITTAGVWFDGVKAMAFGGGKYLVTCTRLINPALGDDSTNRYIAGRIVSPDGSMGSEFRISSGYGSASDVAFDGTNFFVAWTEDQYDTEIRGRFVSPTGVPGTEISVNASAYPSDNPKSVTFDGTNYMVVWSDDVGGTGSWNVFGRKVSPAGALVGGVITITSEAGPQVATSVAFDGINYLATWMDMSNPSDWNVYGQYISTSGALVGSKVTIDVDATNQMGGAGFVNGKYIALLNNGIIMGEGGPTAVEGAYGLFITPSTVPAAPTISSLSSSSGPTGSAITITGTNFVSGGTTVSFNGTLSTSGTVTDAGHVTAYVPSGATTGPIKVVTAGGTATSSSFTVLPPMATLTVYLPGTGSGTVTATSGVTLVCASPDTNCTASASYGTPVTLSEVLSLGSTFSGWSGACTGAPCSFSLDGDKSVTATFTLQQNLRKDLGPYSYYGTLKSAFENAVSGDVILARKMLLPDLSNDAHFDKAGVTVKLVGGFTDAAFTTRTATDFTSVTYPLTIVNGKLILDHIIIKQP
ncbi:MAG: hypothetical protein JJE30_14535 [Desulfuromonadales bacterium]|nr:hypothetical protein [Desulfuromonadales bacterium]